MDVKQARRYLLRIARQIIRGIPLTISAHQMREIADLLEVDDKETQDGKTDNSAGQKERLEYVARD